MKKICLFGDSIAKGVVIDSAKSRYVMTTNCFANIISKCESWMRIINYSMLGCTITKGSKLITRHIKDVESCDVAVLEYGGNDSDHNWAEIAQRPEAEHLPKTRVEDFRDKYLDIISGLKAMDKTVVMLNLPPIDEKKYFNWFSKGLNGENILKWLGGSERYIYDFHAGYNSAVCEIADDNDIPLIDIRSAFLKKGDYSDCLCDDGIHPNEKGHSLIAEVIGAKIPELVMQLA